MAFDAKLFERLIAALDLEEIRELIELAKLEEKRRIMGVKPKKL